MAEKRIRRETAPTTNTTILDLPADILNLIVKQLDQKSLQSIILVSPCFVPLANIFITELTLRHHLLSESKIQKIFRRFPSVKEINLKSTSISRALTAISNSSLNIETLRIYGNPRYPNRSAIVKLRSSPGKLKDVKNLKVRWFGDGKKEVGFRRMVEFIKIFSGIDGLDLSSGGRWEDAGIQLLAQNVRNLRGIKLGQNELLTDQSLDFLAGFCKDLQHFSLDGCSGASPVGIFRFICKFPNLRTLRLPAFSKAFTQAGLLQLGNAIGNLKYITHLAISDNLVNDNVLKAIGKCRLPLTRLEVDKVGTRGLYTMKGLGALLNASRSLTHLKVRLPDLDLGNQDRIMSKLLKLLPQLKSIEIHTLNWFHETLFSLIENCRKLESIVISGDNGKCGSDVRVTPPRKKMLALNISALGRGWRTHCG